MRLNIYYRSPVVWNVVLFIFFSFFFLYLQEVFYNLSSILSKQLIKEFVKENALVMSLYIITICNVLRLSRYAKQLTILTIGLTVVQTVVNLNLEFSKMILVLLFFYLLLFFYVYQFFAMDLEESFYNSKFDKSDLFTPMLTKIEIELLGAEKQIIESGFLTNWSSEGCFVKLKETGNLKGLDSIKVRLEGHEFNQSVILVSKAKDSTGCGLKFIDPKGGRDSNNLGWSEFYEIIEQMGYSPEFLA